MTSISYSLQDGVLTINESVVETKYPVAEAVSCASCVVVRLEIPLGVIGNENIVAYDHDGSMLWRIQKTPHGGVTDSPYVSVDLDGTERLIARNWNGVIYEVNLADGTVKDIDFQRF